MPDLQMKVSRTGATFFISDEDAETTVSVLMEDDKETQLRKLRKVLELAEPETAGLQRIAKAWTEPKPDPESMTKPAPGQQPMPDWLKSTKATPDALPEGVELYREGEE